MLLPSPMFCGRLKVRPVRYSFSCGKVGFLVYDSEVNAITEADDANRATYSIVDRLLYCNRNVAVSIVGIDGVYRGRHIPAKHTCQNEVTYLLLPRSRYMHLLETMPMIFASCRFWKTFASPIARGSSTSGSLSASPRFHATFSGDEDLRSRVNRCQ